MARGTVTSDGSGGENIQHFSTIRLRVTGSGVLNLTVYSLDDVKSKVLVPITLQAKPRIQANRLVNFVEQRASFKLTTTALDEHFRLNRIVVFMKEIYTSYPGA